MRYQMENDSLKEEMEKARESIAVQASIIADGREREWELEAEIQKRETIINLRNQEIAELKARLAGNDEIIAEADEQIERLESELASEKESTSIAIELPESAALLNELKGKRKKSKTDLADIEVLLEILDKQR